MTPLLTKLLAGQLVPVDAAVRTSKFLHVKLYKCPHMMLKENYFFFFQGLAISTFQVVLVPTIVGGVNILSSFLLCQLRFLILLCG